jgi:hypothetical protein
MPVKKHNASFYQVRQTKSHECGISYGGFAAQILAAGCLQAGFARR